MKKIWVDFNDRSSENDVRLTETGLRQVLGQGICVGDRCLISDDEIQMEAVLDRDALGNLVARPDWSTRVDLDQEP